MAAKSAIRGTGAHLLRFAVDYCMLRGNGFPRPQYAKQR